MSAVRDPVFGCLLAQGRRDRDGYAFWGKTRAHIVAWVAANGPVPAGLELDHMCRVRHCREPSHLEAVTRAEQEKRKFLRYRLKRTHCPRGHELAGSNRVLTSAGGVVCRICNSEAVSGARESALTMSTREAGEE